MKDNITIYSPGNIVAVTISNDMEIVDIEIKEDMFTIEQKPLLEEMIISTLNQAYEQIQTSSNQKEKVASNNTYNESDSSTKHSINFMENFDKVKETLGVGGYDDDVKLKTSIGDIMKDFKIEYKDGRPYCSMPMDMLDNEAIMNMMDMFNGGRK